MCAALLGAHGALKHVSGAQIACKRPHLCLCVILRVLKAIHGNQTLEKNVVLLYIYIYIYIYIYNVIFKANFGHFGSFQALWAVALANMGQRPLETARNHLFEHPKWSRNNLGQNLFGPLFDPQVSLANPTQAHTCGAPLVGATRALKGVGSLEMAQNVPIRHYSSPQGCPRQ